jgi:hypothetical protein
MKIRILTIVFFLAMAAPLHAGTIGYAQCGAYDAYLMLYKSTEKLEEVGKLRCGERLEILSRSVGYSQVQTMDGRLGWVRNADLSDAPPLPRPAFTLGFTELPKDVQSDAVPSPPHPFLTNEDILRMHGMHHRSDFILDKIKSSRCAFDTSPAAIQKLQAAGIPDKVVLAMLEIPLGPVTAATNVPESIEVKIPDGTAIEVELTGSVSSEELQDGTIVKMSAAEDLVVDGVPIILRGSAARARVMAVRQHGGSGEVAWFMQDIVAINGDHIALTFASKQPGKDRTRNFEGYPFFLTEFHRGSPVIKATDKHFRAVVHGDTVLRVSQSLAANLPAPQTKAQSLHEIDHSAVEPEATSSSQSSAEEVKP